VVLVGALVGGTCKFAARELLDLLLCYGTDPAALQSCCKWSSLGCHLVGWTLGSSDVTVTAGVPALVLPRSVLQFNVLKINVFKFSALICI